MLRKGGGMFIPANQNYTYDVGPDGVEVLEFRNANKFHIKFAGNDKLHVGRMVDATRKGKETWSTETPPSQLTEPAT